MQTVAEQHGHDGNVAIVGQTCAKTLLRDACAADHGYMLVACGSSCLRDPLSTPSVTNVNLR